ncbi:hypothetical protein ACTS94_16350 [Empedobacter falsenii]
MKTLLNKIKSEYYYFLSSVYWKLGNKVKYQLYLSKCAELTNFKLYECLIGHKTTNKRNCQKCADLDHQ